HGRHRPRPVARRARRPHPAADGRPAPGGPRVHAAARRGRARGARLDLALLRCGTVLRCGAVLRCGSGAEMRVLTVNPGSSSLKVSLLDADDTLLAERSGARHEMGPVAAGVPKPAAVRARGGHGGPALTAPQP